MITKVATVKLQDPKVVSAEKALSSDIATKNFEKFAEQVRQIKQIAVKSNDFVYFVARAIHAMERANVDEKGEIIGDGHISEDNGNGQCKICGSALEKNQKGETVEGVWHSAKGIQPYINQNGDGFPEKELVRDLGDGRKAYHTFIGRGLFVNHESQDAEKIRGIILDAAWDPQTKGVDILVACDKVAYPELARQIEAGYSNDVSMGTQVQHSICSSCFNKAITEADYCNCVKTSKGMVQANGNSVYEINNGINFIEISVVANGADPNAKVRKIIAMLNNFVQEKKASVCEAAENKDDTNTNKIQKQLNQVRNMIDKIANGEDINEEQELQEVMETKSSDFQINSENDHLKTDDKSNVTEAINEMRSEISKIQSILNSSVREGVSDMKNKKAYFQGTEDPANAPYPKEDYTTVRDNEDKQMVGQGMESGKDGMHPGYGLGSDENVKKDLLRANLEERKARRRAIAENISKEAYFQGTEDPENTPYEKEDYTTVRDNEDKQMVGQGMESGKDGLHPGYGMGSDENVKKELLRAKLRAAFKKADNKKDSRWTVFAGNEPILSVTADEAYGEDLEKQNIENPEQTNWDWMASEEYGHTLIQSIKERGLDKVAAEVEQSKKTVKAQVAPEMPAAPAEQQPAGQQPESNMGEGEPVDIDINIDEQGVSGDEVAPNQEAIKEALDQIRSAVEEIEAVSDLSSEEGEEVELKTDLEEAGGELEDLDKALQEMPAEGEQAAAAKSKLNTLTKQALKDAKQLCTFAKGLTQKKKASKGNLPKPKIQQVAGAKCKSCNKEEELDDKGLCKACTAKVATRKATRRKIAQELYGLTDSKMTEQGHPEGGTHTEAGDKPVDGDGLVETQTEQQVADVAVATKDPHGELVARSKKRRELVAQLDEFIEEPVDEYVEEEAEHESLAEEALKALDMGDLDKARDLIQQLKSEESAEVSEALDEELATEETTLDDFSDEGLSDELVARRKNRRALIAKMDDEEDSEKEDKEDSEDEEDDKEEKTAKAKARLKKLAEVDPEAKKYYKELYDIDPDAKKFADDLTKDYAQSSSKKEASADKSKMHRAYAVALRQVKLGQIKNSRQAVENQVNNLVEMDDKSFASFERAVNTTEKQKKEEKSITASTEEGGTIRTAGALRVGQGNQDSSLTDQLVSLPWSTGGRA